MKLFILSALVLSIAVAQTTTTASATTTTSSGTKYYIGKYSADGIVETFPYPLDVCLSTNSATTTYYMFTCSSNHTMIMTTNYTDSACKDKITTTSATIGSTAGQVGYASCVGSHSYLIGGQYIGSCASWKAGDAGIATTIVSMGACTYNSVKEYYTQTTCTSDTFTTKVYGTSSCASSLGGKTYPICGPFENVTGVGTVYSAMYKCVMAEQVQRCSSALSIFTGAVTFEKLTATVNYTQVFTELFPYATVMVSKDGAYSVTLEISFCSPYEYNAYATTLKSLATKVVDQIEAANPNAMVCWNCTSFTCTNATLCGTASGYCSKSTSCYPAKKSASIISVSMVSLLMLAVSFIAF